MKRVAVATFARSEYGSLRAVISCIRQAPDLELALYVGGAHLLKEFGETVREIEKDGFPIANRVAVPFEPDSPVGAVRVISRQMSGFADIFARRAPDLLLLAGDRSELLGIATAATLFRIPLAHISGGEETEGAIDNQVRHAMSKMSQLHFVSTDEHARRLQQMGEESWRIHVTGDPALDLLVGMPFVSREDLARELGVPLAPPLIVATYHPTTLGAADSGAEIREVLMALEQTAGTLVMTYPNADVGHREIIAQLQESAVRRPSTVLVPSLGQRRYYSLLACADLMVGNSSSGIWESPSFRLPVVNIGDRQKGRFRAPNVVDVGMDHEAIRAAICQALEPRYRAGLQGLTNPYGDGHAAPRIVAALQRIPLGLRLLQKRFIEQGQAPRGKETT